ncbi:response regulator of citrate/malate metabolism [Paraburkholderia sp. 35.1]
MMSNGKMQRMFRRQKQSAHEMARLTSMSRNTIRKYPNLEVQEGLRLAQAERWEELEAAIPKELG